MQNVVIRSIERLDFRTKEAYKTFVCIYVPPRGASGGTDGGHGLWTTGCLF